MRVLIPKNMPKITMTFGKSFYFHEHRVGKCKFVDNNIGSFMWSLESPELSHFFNLPKSPRTVVNYEFVKIPINK